MSSTGSAMASVARSTIVISRCSARGFSSACSSAIMGVAMKKTADAPNWISMAS